MVYNNLSIIRVVRNAHFRQHRCKSQTHATERMQRSKTYGLYVISGLTLVYFHLFLMTSRHSFLKHVPLGVFVSWSWRLSGLEQLNDLYLLSN